MQFNPLRSPLSRRPDPEPAAEHASSSELVRRHVRAAGRPEAARPSVPAPAPRPDARPEDQQAARSLAALLVGRAKAAARRGDPESARGLLFRAVELDPRSEEAWLWLAGVVEEPALTARCLETVLSINPENQHARRGLFSTQDGAGSAPPGVPA